MATDSSQHVVWSANYQPFGQTGTTQGTIVQDVRLPGQQTEIETGFNHNGFRDYVPNLGRYLESDPIGLARGTNTYADVLNNPLIGVDPMGDKLYVGRPRLLKAKSTRRCVPKDTTCKITLATRATSKISNTSYVIEGKLSTAQAAAYKAVRLGYYVKGGKRVLLTKTCLANAVKQANAYFHVKLPAPRPAKPALPKPAGTAPQP